MAKLKGIEAGVSFGSACMVDTYKFYKQNKNLIDEKLLDAIKIKVSDMTLREFQENSVIEQIELEDNDD
jgi:hypothetical protein